MGDAAQAADRLVTPVRQFPESGELLLVDDAARWAPFSGRAEHVPVVVDRATIDTVWARAQPLNAAWCVVLAAHPGQATEALEVALRQAGQTLGTQDWWQRWGGEDSPIQMRVLAMSVIPLADIAARELPVHIAERERQHRRERQQALARQQWHQERARLEVEHLRLQPKRRDIDEMWGCWAIFFGLIGAFILLERTGSLLQDLTSTPEDEWEPMFWMAGLIWGTVALAGGALFARRRTVRRTSMRELEAVLALPPPWEDPGMAWSDSEENWVPKS